MIIFWSRLTRNPHSYDYQFDQLYFKIRTHYCETPAEGCQSLHHQSIPVSFLWFSGAFLLFIHYKDLISGFRCNDFITYVTRNRFMVVNSNWCQLLFSQYFLMRNLLNYLINHGINSLAVSVPLGASQIFRHTFALLIPVWEIFTWKVKMPMNKLDDRKLIIYSRSFSSKICWNSLKKPCKSPWKPATKKGNELITQSTSHLINQWTWLLGTAQSTSQSINQWILNYHYFTDKWKKNLLKEKFVLIRKTVRNRELSLHFICLIIFIHFLDVINTIRALKPWKVLNQCRSKGKTIFPSFFSVSN